MRSFQNKKGVSLIAVLLFMLVATIAATATFKWLSSSNSSSGSRMAQQEAYQSSLAGLENARTWMTYHANDVGSLIKQYKDANKSKSASDNPIMIKLNNQLKSLTRSGQEYDVWLAGVNTEESTYKLKILSTGKARNGSVYSQVGIFNVDGLYQVKKPVKKEESSGKLDFSYAYFGGSYVGAGDVYMTSGMVNGDWSGTPQNITENFVITGNLMVDGSNFKANNVCIGGKLDVGSSDKIVASNLYLIGGLTPNKYNPNNTPEMGASISGDFYLEGGNVKAKKRFTVEGSMTVKGRLDIGSSMEDNLTIAKDLCVEENGVLSLNNGQNNHGFEVANDVWISNPNGVTNSKSSTTKLGKNSSSLVYVEGAVGSGASYTQGSTGSFSTSATSGHFSANTPSYDKPNCAQSIKDRCNATWKKESHCGTNYKIDDPIVTAYEKFEKYANKGCEDVNSWNPTAISNCYANNASDEEKAKTNLYNGYQVVKITQTLNNKDACKNGTFKGKFIFIVENQISCQENLTRVEPYGSEENGFVFLYLKQGASELGGTIQNYFIYSKAPIKNSLQLNLDGTLYIPSDVCGGIDKIQSSNLQHNQKLLDDMAKAAIVCNNDGTTCGGGSSDPGSGSEETAGEMLYLQNDSYYVANAPQLSVSLETQYKSNESAPTGADASTDLKEDFIVLPRVIYLTTNPYGKLEDYYNVIPLNGLKEEDLDGSVGSCGSIPTSDFLYNRESSSPSPLPSGITVCNYTASVNGQSQTVPFYIVVTGSSESGPVVSFTEAYKAMAKNGSYTVNVNVPAHDGNFTLKVSAPESDEQWAISGGTCSNGECTFTIGSDQDGVVPLFNVTSKADKGTANFQLLAGEGYSVGSPGIISLSVNTSVTINRTDVDPATLSAYCTNNSGDCPTRSTDWPNCSVADGVSWVRADNGVEGNNCTQATANEEWNCPTAASIKLTSITEGNDCIVIIPENEFIELSTLTTGESYTLHASAKARPLTFTFGFAGRDYADESITASVEGKPDVSAVTCLGSKHECTLEVFEGEQVNVTYGETKPENFNFWSCTGTDCPTVRPQTGKVYSVIVTNGTNEVLAHYNEKDEHCFFDEFKLTSSDCSGSTPEDYCIGTNGKKWKSSDLDKLDYQDGSISVKPNKMDKAADVTVMSTAVAGFEGIMKAQFQVPRVAKVTGAEIPETVKNSGIILRSDEYGDNYLLLNIYADNEGALTARLCKKDGSGCITKLFDSPSGKLSISSSEAIVTLTITMTAEGIELGAVSNASRFTSSSSDLRTAEYKYAIDGFSTYQSSGEYLGFRLADPGFRLFDIGWYSKDYEANCWDTPPTVICSFKAAYPSGIVPIYDNVKGNYAKPWVGLSSWYDAAGCEVSYLYKGTDACGGTTYDYTECGSDGYDFSEDGLHGIVSGTDTSLAARAGVQNCSNLGEKDSYMEALGEKAFCGSFWVGKMEGCKTGIEYTDADENDGAKIYKTENATENLRMTTLTIELQNSDNAEIEVYLISQDDGTGEFTSKSFVTKANTVINVPVDSILDAAGFNPEKVTSVAIAIPGGASVTIQKVYTTCPNEVSLSCDKNLEYNAAAHRWEYSVRVNNYTKLASLETWGFSGNGLVMEPIPGTTGIADQKCEGNDGSSTQCDPTVDGKSATYYFYIDDYPYKDPKDYAFVVKLTDQDGVTYDDNSKYGCATNVVPIEPISRECSIDQSSVKQSAGIPQFHYSVSGCPSTTGCSYKITLLTEEGTEIGIDDIVNVTNSKGGNGTTGGSEANRTTALDIGNYKYRLESTDENLPFNRCEQTFKVEQGVPATGTCAIDKNTNTLSISVTGANNADAVPVTIIYNDNIGNVIGTYTVDIGESLTDNINLKDALTAGSYTIAMVINSANISCGSYERIADLSLPCPNIEFVAPTATFNSTVTGCEKGDCSWSISDGTTSNAATVSYSSGTISIANANPGTKYTITVTRGSDDEQKKCTVDFKSESNINATCTFDKSVYEWYESLSKVKITNPNSKDYNGMAYRFTWKAPGATAESPLASGNLGSNNSILEISTSHRAQPGSYYVYLDGGSKPACTMTLASGSGLPTMGATGCKASSTSIPTSGTTKISATLTKCNSNSDGTSNCTWYIKKNGGSTPVKSGSYGDKVDQAEVSGPGTYTIHLLSADADASCTVEVTKASPASGCKLSDASRNYGDSVQFQAKVTATSGTTYEIIDPNGNTVVSNSFTQNYNNQNWNYTFHAKVSGSYTLKIGGEEACSNASMTVSPAYLNNCKFDPTSVPEGNSSSFKFKINNCKNNECSFSLKKDGYVVSGDAYTKSSQPEGDYSLSSLTEAGNYVLWLNGEETDCSATLTVAAGGTLSCSFPSEAFAGDEGKIHVVSSRASGKYDAYIDGSRSKENFDISENGTVDVSFKIPSVGTHTWKITPHGSSTSLCDGSFNSTSDLKADCWFIYNNGGATVSGTVAPETQLQFCIGPANAHKEVSISGKKKGGDLSEKRWTETSQNSCVYFEAPSSSGSYPFSATYNSNEVCNTSQTLVVQAPPSVTSCSVSATSLTSTETATFSASVANVTSWSLKQDGTEIKYGGSTTSISETITGFGEYKLYLNGETTAKCTKTISEKPAGGEVTSIGTLTSFDQKITAKNGECFKININSGNNGRLRCGHGWQNGSCSIKVTYGGNSTTMTDSYCNNVNGNPLSIGVMNSLDPDAVACVEITGASDTQCFVTSW